MNNRIIAYVAFALLLAGLAFGTLRQYRNEPAGVLPVLMPTSTPGEEIIEDKNKITVTESDNDKTLVYTKSSRFAVTLSEDKYPLPQDWGCAPAGVIGYAPDLSSNGPNQYPIGFEALHEGTCTLVNNDFKVNIIVIE